MVGPSNNENTAYFRLQIWAGQNRNVGWDIDPKNEQKSAAGPQNTHFYKRVRHYFFLKENTAG